MLLDQDLLARQAELEQLGFKVLQVEPDQIVAGRSSFYWDCIFTMMNYTVFVRRVTTLSEQIIKGDRPQLLTSAKTLNQSALPRGFQSGNAILVVYLADEIEHEAQSLCKSGARLSFAQFYLPAAVNVTSKATFVVNHTPPWGAVYYCKFRYILNRLLAPQGRLNREPSSIIGIIITSLLLLLFLVTVLAIIVSFAH